MSVAVALAYLVLLGVRVALAHREADRQANGDGRAGTRAEAASGPSIRPSTGRAPSVEADPPVAWTDVVVLQPILSGDPALESVLGEALVALPQGTHVVWLVDEDDPEGLRITAALAASARAAARPGPSLTRLVTPAPAPHENPKTVKLARGVDATSAPVIVVLDDDARLDSGALGTLVTALGGGALATALPWYEEAEALPGALLARFVGDNAAITYLAPLAFVGPVSVNGMCYAIRRETLGSIGGFRPLARHLTDDLALALALSRRGLRIVQTHAPVRMHTSLADLPEYVRLMHRWHLFATLLLGAHGARVRLLAVAVQGVHPVLLWWLVGSAALVPSIASIGALGAVIAVRTRALGGLHRRFAPGLVRARPALSVVAELLQPLHLAHASLARTIRWRTRRYRVRAIDDFVECRSR